MFAAAWGEITGPRATSHQQGVDNLCQEDVRSVYHNYV